jgi:outer membrane protein OmpA-like peptidoglycan-associated protein
MGCSSLSSMQKGTGVGAAAGGTLGAVIGQQSGHTLEGALIGAALGGAAGALIGHQMDQQADDIKKDLEGVEVERVAEGIKLHFDSGILFEVDKAELGAQARQNLDKLAGIFQKYPDTNVLIEGHTDASGSSDHNMTLSNQRAAAVQNYLASKGVTGQRMTSKGYGEEQPVASNDTADGKRLNRRVELAVMANDKMKKAAEQMAGPKG